MTSTTRKPRTTRTPKARPDLYQEVTDEIIAALEEGTVPWHRPWSLSGGPTSLTSGKPYRGINIFILGSAAQRHGYTSKWWGTFKQIKESAVKAARVEGREIVERTGENGSPYYAEVVEGTDVFFRGGVRKGEKATTVVFWKLLDKKDAAGEVVGKIPILNYYKVFNADQADGLDLDEGDLRDHDVIESCETIRDGYLGRAFGLTLQHGGDRASYNSALDRVQMPKLNDFDTAELYYGVLFHEFGHSTGHDSRLKREASSGNVFGSPDYSREELVAEMTAAFVCGEAGIDVNVPNTAAYIDSWLQALRNDKKLLVSAGGAAQKAADLILGPQDEAEDVKETA